VLGANDGIVSVAAVIVGVAGATSAVVPVLTAGVAALVGGAVSMALGEYVSVSSQSDSQRALLSSGSGVAPESAPAPEEEIVSAWQAAAASAVAFLCGAVLPMIAVLIAPAGSRVAVTFAAVALALAATGLAGARIGGAPAGRAIARTVAGGALALAVTWIAGSLLGAQLAL
jgi:VIT1/CCC1 family predicted Fe2+/Mn2+ transporter